MLTCPTRQRRESLHVLAQTVRTRTVRVVIAAGILARLTVGSAYDSRCCFFTVRRIVKFFQSMLRPYPEQLVSHTGNPKGGG